MLFTASYLWGVGIAAYLELLGNGQPQLGLLFQAAVNLNPTTAVSPFERSIPIPSCAPTSLMSLPWPVAGSRRRGRWLGSEDGKCDRLCARRMPPPPPPGDGLLGSGRRRGLARARRGCGWREEEEGAAAGVGDAGAGDEVGEGRCPLAAAGFAGRELRCCDFLAVVEVDDDRDRDCDDDDDALGGVGEDVACWPGRVVFELVFALGLARRAREEVAVADAAVDDTAGRWDGGVEAGLMLESPPSSRNGLWSDSAEGGGLGIGEMEDETWCGVVEVEVGGWRETTRAAARPAGQEGGEGGCSGICKHSTLLSMCSHAS